MTSNSSYPWGTAQQLSGGSTNHANPPQTSTHISPSQKKLQRKLSDLLIDNKHLLYSQWFPGSTNAIPDILSRDWHLDYGKILNLLSHLLPTHLHPYFRLAQVPSVIESILWSVLQSLSRPTQTWKKPNPGVFALGLNAVSSCNQSSLEVMSFWRDSAVG